MTALTRILLAFVVLSGGAAHGQGFASATASCTILKPVMLQNQTPSACSVLLLSAVSPGPTDVELSGQHATDRTAAPQAIDWAAARLRISGGDGASFSLMVSEDCVLKRAGGTDELVADRFACSPDAEGNPREGEQSINVGAVLHVGAGQPLGTYAGRFRLAVAYE